MSAMILIVFFILRFAQRMVEHTLSRWNRQYYIDTRKQQEAARLLRISDDDIRKTLLYTEDKYHFGTATTWIRFLAGMGLILAGGLGVIESGAKGLAAGYGGGSITTGLFFFGILGALTFLFNIPFSLYSTFRIEAHHGFNRQTIGGFFKDLAKGMLLAVILGGALISLILWIMEKLGDTWWLWAWGAMAGFSLFAAWLYPTLIAPLFNKFRKLEEGELKSKINDLAKKIGFDTDGIYVMDASKRSSHGNAYFTGVFKKKRIVLFDTLVDMLKPDETVAVLAHELGHFKLHHVRSSLIRGICLQGLMFWGLSKFLPLTDFYTAFHLEGASTYGALTVFSLWFGLFEFVIQPVESFLSRRNEFAADAFAGKFTSSKELSVALLKMREKSHAMPITHPAYSAMYHSHPPILERLRAMKYLPRA